jgi:hypothetical protein
MLKEKKALGSRGYDDQLSNNGFGLQTQKRLTA